MTRAARCFCAFLLTTATVPSEARAAPGDATRLEYARSERAASCPDRSALQAAVGKRLGYEPFFPAARQTVVVEIIDFEGGLRAQMRLVNENGLIVGSRELRENAGHCDELVASLALAISIALDPSAALGEPPATPVTAHPAPAEPLPEPARESDAQEHPPKKTSTRGPPPAQAEHLDRQEWAVRSTLFADLGDAPALAFGWRVGLDGRRNWFRFAAEFSQQFLSSKELANGGRARASLLAGSVSPCLASELWAGCALLTLGSMQTLGEDIPNPSRHTTFYAALGARIEFTPTLLGRLQLLTQAEVMKPLTPVSLRVVGLEVWQTPLLTFAGSVGLRWRFF